MWFNGYIAPNLVNQPRGVQGLPSDYKPYSAAINNTPGTADFGNNNVSVRLNNGTSVTTAYNPGPTGIHPFGFTSSIAALRPAVVARGSFVPPHPLVPECLETQPHAPRRT
jgi:hypothetical protein